jgi:hypothetical protein
MRHESRFPVVVQFEIYGASNRFGPVGNLGYGKTNQETEGKKTHSENSTESREEATQRLQRPN